MSYKQLGPRRKRKLQKMMRDGGGIRYKPSELLVKLAPESRLSQMLTTRMTLKKTALSFLDDVPKYLKGVITKKDVARVALQTVKSYKERVRDDGGQKTEILDDPKQLIQRVQNEVLFQIKGEIRDKYAGEFYRWLPSDAETPDPEHQLNYGKVFQVGVGEMPGDRYGCRCGMEILVDEKQLNLKE